MKNKTIKSLIIALICACMLFVPTVNAFALTDGTDTALKSDSIEVGSRFFELIFGKKDKVQQSNKKLLCLGGDAFGIRISGSGVTVSKIIDESASAPLRQDDKILAIDGKQLSTISEVKNILNSSGGRVLEFEISRNGKVITLDIAPHAVGEEYHLGVILSDGASGIGTITYYDPETLAFGGLGHGICEKDSQNVLKMTRGEASGVILSGARRAEVAKPGELRGVLTDKIIGTVDKNTPCGVFGTLSSDALPTDSRNQDSVEIAHRDEIKEGAATIIATVKSGKKAEYGIEIFDIDKNSTESKSFKIRVTDDTLLALTGGIVRGMSGSPIIQNGKLVGAVTHVLINDPTTGYGIFIENMLNAAQMPMAKAS